MQIGIGKELRVVGALVPLIRQHPRSVSFIVVVGVLSSLAEGLGIGLFIPFLQTLDASQDASAVGSGPVGLLGGMFNKVPVEHRLFVISLCILAHQRDSAAPRNEVQFP